MRTCIRNPGIDRTSLLEIVSAATNGFEVGDVPVIDLVAVNAQDGGLADAAEKSAAVKCKHDAPAGGIVITGNEIDEMVAHPRQRQFDIMIAERDDQAPVLGAGEFPEGFPDWREGDIPCDTIELLDRTIRIERFRAGLRQEVDHVAIDHQGDLAGPGSQKFDQLGELRT
jgi:hypothetical protein